MSNTESNLSPITDIVVGERVRRDVGDVREVAQTATAGGGRNPCRWQNVPVASARRLACRRWPGAWEELATVARLLNRQRRSQVPG
jgi:hypothetical protein